MLDLYHLERRRERYFINYTWKIMNGDAPNLDDEDDCIRTTTNIRRGNLSSMPSLNTRALTSINALTERCFTKTVHLYVS